MNVRTRLRKLLEEESRRRKAVLDHYLEACCLKEGLPLAPQARRCIAEAARTRLHERGFGLGDADCLTEAWRQWARAWEHAIFGSAEAGFIAPDLERVPAPPEEPPGLWHELEREAAEGEAGAGLALLVLMLARGLHRYREERMRGGS